MEKCENCGRQYPEVNIHSHFAYCRRNIRKCKKCGEFIDINEEEQHIQQQHFRQPCQYCNKSFKRQELMVHEDTCLWKNTQCQYCELQYKVKDLDEHVAVCGSRTKECEICGKNTMLLEYKGHVERCQRKLWNAPPPVQNKYRVERLDGKEVKKESKKMSRNTYEDDLDFEQYGFSAEEIETQRILYEQIRRAQKMH